MTATQAAATKFHDSWVVAEDMINCRECHAPQFMSQARDYFMHVSGCTLQARGQRPWIELLEVMERLKAAGE